VNSKPSTPELIDLFMQTGPYAVVGASTNRNKYGNKVLRAYLQRGFKVYPINPTATEVEGLRAYPDLASLPEKVVGISVITPPQVTEKLMDEAARVGVRYVWMQPGAESPAAVEKAARLGMQTIADGSCFLVVAGFSEGAGHAAP
jgi:predicted CoA-binding protein